MKKILWIVLAAALLLCALMAGAEDVPVDTRIARITSTYECGCERYYYGVMIGRNGLLTKACSFYCPEHGKTYTNVLFEFGSPEAGVSVCQYRGDFYLKTFDNFKTGYNYESDIAYVRFPELIGDKTGWYRLLTMKDESDLNNAQLVIRENTRDGYRETVLPGFQIVSAKALKTAFTEIETARGLPVLMLDENGDDAVIGIANAYTDGEGESAIYIRRATSVIRNQMFADEMFKEGDASYAPRVTAVFRADSVPAAAEETEAEAAVVPAEPVKPATPMDPGMAVEPEPSEESEPTAPEAPEAADEPAAPEAPETVNEFAESEGWTCPECGRQGNTENFCPQCGTKKPETHEEWTCPMCEREGNTENFCPNCGEKRPET